jgi:polyisoprenoid-binding protein YceI
MTYNFKKYIIASVFSLASLSAGIDEAASAVPSWNISSGSQLNFTATENGAKVPGSFKDFKGQISFDPEQLGSSKIKIIVTIGSVFTSYAEAMKSLVSPEWFDAKAFPQAVYEASSFTKTGDKTFTADGNLTIRGKSVPVTLNFTLNQYTPQKAAVTGSTKINRSDFGVGQGEWAGTDVVKDEVEINFTINATAGK